MKPLLIATLCGLLVGCSGLRSSRSVEQVYVLHANSAALKPSGGEVVAGVLRVPRPSVQPGLDTNRVALTRADNELDYFADSRWGESLPKVIGAFAAESLAHANLFETVVGVDGSSVPGDFDLLLTVRHFEAVYGDGVPRAQVTFECVLLGGAPRHVLGRCDAEAQEPAGENRLGAIVGALERAAQKAMADAGSRAAELARAFKK